MRHGWVLCIPASVYSIILISGCAPGVQPAFDEHQELEVLTQLSKTTPNLGAKCDCRGQTLLHHAARDNYPQVAAMLLKLGADGHDMDYQGTTPIMKCAEFDSVEVARLIVEHPNFGRPGSSELQIAIQKEHSELVELFIRAGVDVNSDYEHSTPLFEALRAIYLCRPDSDQMKILRALIRAGANVNEVNESETPLHVAVNAQCMLAVEMLLDAGADPTAIDSKGYTPLHCLAESAQEQFHDASQIARALVAAGAKLDAKVPSGETPLKMADLYGAKDLAKTLRELGEKGEE